MDSSGTQPEAKAVTARIEAVDGITETVYNILKGKSRSPIAMPVDYPNDEIRQCGRVDCRSAKIHQRCVR